MRIYKKFTRIFLINEFINLQEKLEFTKFERLFPE